MDSSCIERFKYLRKIKSKFFRPSFVHWFDEDDLIQESALWHMENKGNINHYNRTRYSVMRKWLHCRDISLSNERLKSDAQFIERSYSMQEYEYWAYDKIMESELNNTMKIAINLLLIGYTYSDIAEELGVSCSYVTHMMKKIRPVVSEILSDYLLSKDY